MTNSKHKQKNSEVRKKGVKKSSATARAMATTRDVQAPRPKETAPRGRFSSGRRLGFLCVVLVILGVGIYSGLAVFDLKAEEKKANEELKAKKLEKERVEREFSVVTNPEYVENQARELLRMIKAGEMLYVFETEEEDSQ